MKFNLHSVADEARRGPSCLLLLLCPTPQGENAGNSSLWRLCCCSSTPGPLLLQGPGLVAFPTGLSTAGFVRFLMSAHLLP